MILACKGFLICKTIHITWNVTLFVFLLYIMRHRKPLSSLNRILKQLCSMNDSTIKAKNHNLKKKNLCTVQSQIKARKIMTIFCISQETWFSAIGLFFLVDNSQNVYMGVVIGVCISYAEQQSLFCWSSSSNCLVKLPNWYNLEYYINTFNIKFTYLRLWNTRNFYTFYLAL